MQRYLRPDLLRAAGVEHFDEWAATFGQTVTEIEMAPTGGGNYRMNTRFARFQNVPEMLRMWHVFADVKTAEDLDLPTPELKARLDGERGERRGPETVVIPAGRGDHRVPAATRRPRGARSAAARWTPPRTTC